MTLLLALGNSDFVTVVADRRFTINGAVCDDEANKVCILCCDDARVAIAFTGLAEAGSHSTQEWLLASLADIAKTTHVFADTLVQLRARATSDLGTIATPDRRLTFIIAGFEYWSEHPAIACYYLSNCDNASGRASNTFELRTLNAHADGILIEALGVPGALKGADERLLRAMLAERKRASDVVRKAVHSIQAAAGSGAARGLVGKQCNSAVVPGLPNTTMISTYHSAHLTGEAYAANVAFSMSRGGLMCWGARMLSASLVAGPMIRKRDACWCGSGKLFKHCHMKILGSVYAKLPGFTRPMTMVTEVSFEIPVASGNRFRVASAFE
jgi:hypothetical protein